MKLSFLFSLYLFLFFALFLSCGNQIKEKQKELKNIPYSPPIEQEVIEESPFKIDYDSTKWIELGFLDNSFSYDLRYATKNNFVKEKMYDCGRCFVRPEVGKALVEINNDLKQQGYGGLKMFDCYRPRPFQQRLWDKVPNPRYVTNPAKGSMHNRGAAVDLTIIDNSGQELDMGTDFDFFGREAHYKYEHNDTIQFNRKLLRGIMMEYGFKGITSEWWHFSYRLKNYALSDWIWNCYDEDTGKLIPQKEQPKVKEIKVNRTVNTTDELMGKFEPKSNMDFVVVSPPLSNREMYLRKEAAEAFSKMREAAKRDGINLLCISATRNFYRQKSIWEAKWNGTRKVDGQDLSKSILDVAERALKILEYSSMPGTSRHHWGTDIDINNLNNSYFESGKGLQEYQWLTANAYKFGFNQPYTNKVEDNRTGYNEEKWHWSYTPLAQKMTQEFVSKIKNEDIKGFQGAESAAKIDVISNYVLGVHGSCK